MRETALHLIREIDTSNMLNVIKLLQSFAPNVSVSAKNKPPVENLLSQVPLRAPGALAGMLVSISDDFDETPDCLESYI